MKSGDGTNYDKKIGFRSSGKVVKPLVFVDVFAGCGGLSLGLLNSGWKGLFAVEQSVDAFKTLRYNLIDKRSHNHARPVFTWPSWLDIEAQEIQKFIAKYETNLKSLKGKVDLIAGGPPCQGFSVAGKRNNKDPRNELFKCHLKLVELVKPKVVFLENVQGIDIAFGGKRTGGGKGRGRPRKSYAARIKEALSDHEYHVQQELVRAVDFGVPQLRPRYFTVGIRNDIFFAQPDLDFFDILSEIRVRFLERRQLPIDCPVTVAGAISDLRVVGKKTVPCTDPESRGSFKEITYGGPASTYQRLMHGDMNGQAPNSLRLPNHRLETVRRFKDILQTCRKGVQLSSADRDRLGLRKTSTTPLAPDRPSHTLTTLPDDFLHYAEPRIHTVREHARLQSFPDWFEFHGKYTTGGQRRTQECPRYTQVGNAVPPLLAEATGEALKELLDRTRQALRLASSRKRRSKRNGCR